MTDWTKTRGLALVAATTLVLCAAGCAKDATPATSTPATSASPGAGETTAAGAPEGSGTPSAAATSASVSGDAVGTQSVTKDGNTYSLAVYPLTRSGKTVTLRVQLRVGSVTSAHLKDLSLLSVADDAISRAMGVPNGIALVDTVGQKLYLPATRTQQASTAVCSPTFPADVAQGDQVMISCTYAGIPDGVTALDVAAPSFGTFSHVPLR